MNPIVIVAFAVILSVAPASCDWCENQLYKIDGMLKQVAEDNNIGVYGTYRSYSSKTKYVLEQLHAKINTNKNRGSGQCKPLEDEINKMSQAFSIEKEGLEDYPTRLQKLFDYLNDREKHQLQEVERQKTLQSLCAGKNHDLNDAVKALNKTINEHAAKIRSQEVQIAKLQEEKRKLAAKVNKNAAAIDGQTGSVTGTELEAKVNENAADIDGLTGNVTGTDVPKMAIDVQTSDGDAGDSALQMNTTASEKVPSQ